MRPLLVSILVLGVICHTHANDGDIWNSTLTYAQLKTVVEKTIPEKVTQRFQLDLNKDNLTDQFFGVVCGNGGCQYHVFIQVSSGLYKYHGAIFLHKLGFEILAVIHHGLPDILAYLHTSAITGTLVRYEFDGEKYVKTGSYDGSSDLFPLLNVTQIADAP